MAQLKKVTQKFQDKAYVGKVNTTGLARLLHVNEVIDWVRGAADLEFVSNADAIAAGLKRRLIPYGRCTKNSYRRCRRINVKKL